MTRVSECKNPLRGELTVPGDKSIGHRAVIFSCIAEGESRIVNHSGGEDNSRTVKAFKEMGVRIWSEGGALFVRGQGWEGLLTPSRPLDCGNSGTTMRLLTGVLAGRSFEAVLDGDDSLRSRPMQRVIDPMRQMGALISGRDNSGLAPLKIKGGNLKGICYDTPVASAQVKSAIVLAALQAAGNTVVREPQKSRDHTEIMARTFGAKLKVEGCSIELEGPQDLTARAVTIPGDLSSAAFFAVAAASIPGSDLTVRAVGCNSTRTGFVDVLRRMGASVQWTNLRDESGEPVGDLRVAGRQRLKGVSVGEEMVSRTIDEYPALAVAGALAEGTTTFTGVGELRTKESDRIATMTRELRALGVEVEEAEDGMRIQGRPRLEGAGLRSHGDHRVAMALAVAGLSAAGGIEIDDSRCVDISFPGFFELLDSLR